MAAEIKAGKADKIKVGLRKGIGGGVKKKGVAGIDKR